MINVFDVYGVEPEDVNKYSYNPAWYKYPEITADKILALEEVILKRIGGLDYDNILGIYYEDNQFVYSLEFFEDTELWENEDHSCVIKAKTRLEALSNLLVKLYDEFSKEERRQVVSILEGK